MADKNITTVNEISSVDDSDKVFVNDGNTLKQITVINLMKKAPASSGGGGTPGKDGREIEIQNSGTAIQWRYAGDGSWTDLVQLSEITGSKGDPGETPNIQIGSVQTLEPGQQATVSMSGTPENPLLNLGIPKGEKGDPGEGSEAEPYTLPIMSSTQLGGGKAIEKTDEDVPVAVDSLTGQLFVPTYPESGSGAGDSIIVEKANEIYFPLDTNRQSVNISWDQEMSDIDGNYFVNGANQKTEHLPMQLPASYKQVGTLFLEDVIKEAYEGKGNDNYGTVYGLFTLDISEGDSITYLGATCYDAKTKQPQSSPITESGSYYFELIITSAQTTANRPAFKSELGTSSLLSIQAQTKSWASIVSDEYTGKITEFMELFPFETIKDLQLGESLIPQKTGGAEAIVFSNGKEQVITESDNNITIAPNCKILVKKGTLKIEYPLNNDIKIEERKWCNIKWACIGDSYTDTSINATYKYEQIIHDETGINFQMLGVGGTGWWKGYDTQRSYRFRAEQVDEDTDVVTIFGSINDWQYSNSGLTIGNAEDTLPTQSLCAYINDVFDALIDKCPTAHVIVFSPMYYHGLSSRVPELFDAVKSVTEKRGFEYVDMLNTGWLRIENNDAYAQKYCTDFGGGEFYGHPNNLAHKTFIAPKFYAKLKEYIEM